MTQASETTIAVSKEVRNRVRSRKHYSSEPYDCVLRRLLDETDTVTANGDATVTDGGVE